MCTAPVMRSRVGGTCTVRKTLPSAVSSMPLLPERRCASSTSLSGSDATLSWVTSRCAPLSWLVTTTAARRAARSVFSALRMSRRNSIHLLDEHADRPAARQPDLPRGLVRDAELQRLRLAAIDHIERLGHDRAFDAAA